MFKQIILSTLSQVAKRAAPAQKEGTNIKVQKFGILVLAAAFVAASSFPSTASADVFNLADLINDGTALTIGDKKFFDFGYTDPVGAGAAVFGIQSASDINVQTEDAGPFGISFIGPMLLTANKTDLAVDFTLNYKVMTLSGAALINGIIQTTTAGGLNNGGSVQVTESVFNGHNVGLATSTVGVDFGGPDISDPPADFGDLLEFDPEAMVLVQKDIGLIALAGGSVNTTIISQFVTQIPEPGSLSVLGLGVLGLGLGRRRRTA